MSYAGIAMEELVMRAALTTGADGRATCRAE